jgi:hypothetical protein
MKTTAYPRKSIRLLLAIFLGLLLLVIGLGAGLVQSPEPYLVKDIRPNSDSSIIYTLTPHEWLSLFYN